MGPVTAVVTFLIIWWTVLFTVLPLGVRSQAEDGAVAPGTEPGAPVNPNLWRKVRLTTMISVGVWLVVAGVIVSGVVPTP